MNIYIPGAENHADLRSQAEQDVYRDVWEHNVYQLGRDELDGTHVIDVGSNVGLFTAFALFNGAAFVLAVDPVQEHHYRSRLMLGPRHDVGCVTGCAGDGLARMFGPGTGPDQTMVGMRLVDSTEPTPEIVRGYTLDELIGMLPQHDVQPRLIVKVDCEGCEYDLIQTATVEALACVWRFVMEWHGDIAAGHQPAAGRIGRMVEQLIETHSVTVYGDPQHGGMLYAYRY